MILTAKEFSRLGYDLYGPSWPVVMAHRLGRTLKTIRRWRFEVTAMPSELRDQVEALLEEQISMLETDLDAIRGDDMTTYLVLAEDIGRVKIGTSRNERVRLSVLQTGSPVPLKLILSLPAKDYPEEALHVSFARFRTHGEWFEFSPELQMFVAGGWRSWMRPALEFVESVPIAFEDKTFEAKPHMVLAFMLSAPPYRRESVYARELGIPQRTLKTWRLGIRRMTIEQYRTLTERYADRHARALKQLGHFLAANVPVEGHAVPHEMFASA